MCRTTTEFLPRAGYIYCCNDNEGLLRSLIAMLGLTLGSTSIDAMMVRPLNEL